MNASSPESTTHRRVRILFVTYGLLMVMLWAIWPQQLLSVRDEANYFGVAQFLLNEASFDVTRSLELRDGLVPWVTEKNGHLVPQHPLGLSILILPFIALGGFKAGFLFSILLFMAGGWAFLRLLERERVPLAYGILYFLFPPFLLYTRTFMADVPSMVLCLWALLLLESGSPRRRSGWLGGLVLAIAVLIKPPNYLVAVPLAVGFATRCLHSRRSGPLVGLLVPLLAALAVQLGLNHYFLRDPFSFSYVTTDMFRIEYAPNNLRFYLTAWTLVLPGLWIGAVEMIRRRRWVELVIVTLGLLFYSAYNYYDTDSSRWLLFTRGQRFLLPQAAVLLLYYAAFWHRSGLDRWVRRLVPLGLVASLSLFAFASIEQRSRTAGFHRVQQWIYERTAESGDAIVYNRDSCEFIHGIFGRRSYYRFERGEQFGSVMDALPTSVERVCVVETEHRFRKGDPYAASFAARGRPGWNVLQSHDLPDGIWLVWAERSPAGESEASR